MNRGYETGAGGKDRCNDAAILNLMFVQNIKREFACLHLSKEGKCGTKL